MDMTSKPHYSYKKLMLHTLLVIVLMALAPWLSAAVLPEDRTDILYHGYDGGGLQVDGPVTTST